MPWFRRKKKSKEEAAAEVAAVQEAPPAEPAEQPANETAAAPGETGAEAAKKKRRRGTRGGKGRKKATGTVAAAADGDATNGDAPADTADKAEKPKPKERKKREARPERRSERSNRSSTRRRQPPRRAPLPPAKRELVMSTDVGEQRVAVLEDGRVAEVYLERPERRSIAGNIYLGTVDNVLPGMEAAFVEIGLEKNGFLYVDEIVVPELEGKARHGKRIQDLIQRGQTILVQAVKDPMKTKGARLTTEISLPGRFVVYVPSGEGLGVSRRLPDDERTRLKDILKRLDVQEGGVIVRTAAEGASAEDVERDLVFLQKLWKSIQDQAKASKPPSLVYQESELPLRVTRDLFTGDFERALIDDDTAYKRVVGYLKKTSPHMVEKVIRYKEKTPLFESFGVDAEIRSTLDRRVNLPSGGYLIFDYAEAFTVIDVNTGRFVGSRSKSSGARLEDTITKNNLEAVKEVVRQLRLRDIGGIIVIDFIDMANPSNRQTVEDALRHELERDRTKTYVVEISPLGLVEMTRQNVTDGPREILTKKCPTCAGDGIVVSEATAAVDLERKLRALAAAKPRTKAFRIEVSARAGSILIGPGASRLEQIEASTKRRFFLELKDGLHTDHFAVLEEGTLEKLAPKAPVEEGVDLEVKLVEIGLYDPNAAVAKLDGLVVVVAGAAKLVGKTVNTRVNRVLDGTAYATMLGEPAAEAPITAEREAEKPTRMSRPKGAAAKPVAEAKPEPTDAAADEVVADEVEPEADAGAEPEAEVEQAAEDGAETPAPKKKTRRGTRGGRRRRKTGTAASATAASANGGVPADAEAEAAAPKIHIPDRRLDEEAEPEDARPDAVAEPEAAEDGAEPKPKKKTRRGSRGGRRRRKPAGTTTAVAEQADEPSETAA